MQVFKFKKFEIDQSNCAMRINTDGVLLGAIAHHQNPTNILDIGTGTGVIALMLAQRYLFAKVTGIEIEEGAAQTSKRNAEKSQFSDRVDVIHQDILSFKSEAKFDLIVSNPPFFTNDLKNPETKKRLARHTSDDFIEALIKKSTELLSDDGSFWLVLPPDQFIAYNSTFEKNGLYKATVIHLKSFEGKSAFRQIIEFSKHKQSTIENDFILYDAPTVHSNTYKLCLKDYFIAF